MRGFGDVGFSATSDSVPSSFGIGQFDNYVSGRLSERVDFLTEAVIAENRGWRVSLERLWVKYHLSSDVSVAAGKFHTPMGYWNRAYHHGALLQPSIDRPTIFDFGSNGGPLPIHTVGVLLNVAPMGPAEIGLDLVVGNGVGGGVEDNNPEKAFGGRLHGRPSEYLSLGVSGYWDHLSPGTRRRQASDRLAEEMDHRVLAADARLRIGGFDVFGEGAWIQNQTDRQFDSRGYYLLASWSFDSPWTPYVKFDDVRFAEDDPFYGNPDERILALGMRYSLDLLAALKAEVRRVEGFGSADDPWQIHIHMNFGW